jgi:DNA invertase Pin-like site-specific DNA recombinase
MNYSNRLRTRQMSGPKAKTDAVYARSAADDDARTACQEQVRRALELAGSPAGAAVYADPARSGLDPDRPGLRRLLAEVRRGGLRCVVVRDLARLARSAALLETILDELRAAGVELLSLEGAERHA